MATQREVKQLLTPVYRVSFPNMFKPRAAPGSTEEKYSVTMIFPKNITDPAEAALMKALRDEVTAAAVAKWGPDKTKWPTKKVTVGDEVKVVSALRSPWRDGAEKDYDGYGKDVIFITASAKKEFPPKIVGPDLQPLIEPGAFYAGCYARSKVTVFAYDKAGNMGISFGLRNTQKVRDGEPLAGGSDPSKDFDAIIPPAGAPAGAAAGAAAGSDPLGV